MLLNDEKGNIINANGVFEEFKIAIENNVIPIPIPATEFAAKEIWDIVMKNFDDYVGYSELRPLYEKLGYTNESTEIQVIVIDIIEKLLKGG